MAIVTTVALPAQLPAPAATKPAAFPEALRERSGNGGNDHGVLRSDQALFSAPSDEPMWQTAPGSKFDAAVSAAAALSHAGETAGGFYAGTGTAFGVFARTGASQAQDGVFYLAPMYWNSEGNDEGDVFLGFQPGERVQPLSTQLQAVVTDTAWADLRVAPKA